MRSVLPANPASIYRTSPDVHRLRRLVSSVDSQVPGYLGLQRLSVAGESCAIKEQVTCLSQHVNISGRRHSHSAGIEGASTKTHRGSAIDGQGARSQQVSGCIDITSGAINEVPVTVDDPPVVIEKLALCVGPECQLSDLDGNSCSKATADIQAVISGDHGVDQDGAVCVQQQVATCAFCIENAQNLDVTVRQQRDGWRC
jgi:hypothetical protein